MCSAQAHSFSSAGWSLPRSESSLDSSSSARVRPMLRFCLQPKDHRFNSLRYLWGKPFHFSCGCYLKSSRFLSRSDRRESCNTWVYCLHRSSGISSSRRFSKTQTTNKNRQQSHQSGCTFTERTDEVRTFNKTFGKKMHSSIREATYLIKYYVIVKFCTFLYFCFGLNFF